MDDRKPTINNYIRFADIEKDAKDIQKKLAKELKTIVKPDDTAKKLNRAMDDVVVGKEEQLRPLKLGDAMLPYIQLAEEQQRKMREVIEQIARVNVELLRLNAERASDVLSAEQMREMLHQEIPRIRVENHCPDLLAEVDSILATVTQESDKLKSEVTQMQLEQTNSQNSKNNLLVILLMANLIFQFVF